MGGADKVKRQRDQGRLNVRERIDRILDRASFHEIGAVSGIGEYNDKGELTTLTPANCVFGRGKVDGRTVVWGTTDRTEEKALKLAALLTQPGQVYDVSSPDLPTVK